MNEKQLLKILHKQENSRECLVCGLENDFGLKASFYALETQELLAVFTGKNHHQSYPGRLHGGLTGAMLDETIGRAIMLDKPDIFGVTVELNVKYKRPVPLDEEVKVIGRIVKSNRKLFEGTGEIILQDGTIAATATGKYMIMPLEKIMEDQCELDWQVVESDDDPKEVVLNKD